MEEYKNSDIGFGLPKEKNLGIPGVVKAIVVFGDQKLYT